MSSFRVFQLNTIEMHETKTKMSHWHFFLKSVLLFSGTKSWQRPKYRSLSYISFYIHCSTSKNVCFQSKVLRKKQSKTVVWYSKTFLYKFKFVAVHNWILHKQKHWFFNINTWDTWKCISPCFYFVVCFIWSIFSWTVFLDGLTN